MIQLRDVGVPVRVSISVTLGACHLCIHNTIDLEELNEAGDYSIRCTKVAVSGESNLGGGSEKGWYATQFGLTIGNVLPRCIALLSSGGLSWGRVLCGGWDCGCGGWRVALDRSWDCCRVCRRASCDRLLSHCGL